MPFNSYQFIFVFLPLAVVGYWLLERFANHSVQLGWLLLCSVGFYGYADPINLVIVVPSIAFNFLIARLLLHTPPEGSSRVLLFMVGIAGNIAFLGYFKYGYVLLETFNHTFNTNFEVARMKLPLGISFITFQNIAFLVNVHSGQIKSVRPFDFFLFTLFFPRVVAGPIVHYGEVMPQLAGGVPRDRQADLLVGGVLFSIGLFKKVVVADGLSAFVLPAFDFNPSGPLPTVLTTWGGVLAYSFQLYFDFSGYSDMALGVARMFGVRLPMNFNSPLKSCSVIEFWSRWHITLSRFLMWCLYMPMAVRLTRARAAKGKPLLDANRPRLAAIGSLIAIPTLVTMTIAGVWHGAGWQFVVFGALHGIYLTINQSWRLLRVRLRLNGTGYERVMRPLGWILTFIAITVAFVFFRAPSLDSALKTLGGMVGLNGVWSPLVQVLMSLDVELPRFFWRSTLEPFLWDIVLLLAVLLLPNSLELLRGFNPAIDFTNGVESSVEPKFVRLVQRRPVDVARETSLLERLQGTWTVVRRIRYDGIALDRLTMVVVSFIGILSVMALEHSDAFLYWKF